MYERFTEVNIVVEYFYCMVEINFAEIEIKSEIHP